MIIKKQEIERLSADIRRIIDGKQADLRDNREGKLSILKNDIHTLSSKLTEQAATLQKEKKALTVALADISHQLKTPLTSMMLMTELAENATGDKQKEFISNIKTDLIRVEWLVSAILKMAKLESGTIEFNSDNVSFSDLVEAAQKQLKILLEIKKQTVTHTGDCTFFCDKHWTVEALTNIIKNASENSPIGGKIVIEADKNPICAWLSVTDSGAGIPAAEFPVLFERFHNSRNEKGIGIGLPLALAIMRGQNGNIEAENTPIGAKFILKFYNTKP